MSPERDVPAVLVVATITTAACVLLEVGQPLRSVVVGLFMVLAPGAALLLWTRGWPAPVQATAAVSLSISVDVLLATALVYLGWWSPGRVLALLIALCVGCAAARVLTSRRRAATP